MPAISALSGRQHRQRAQLPALDKGGACSASEVTTTATFACHRGLLRRGGPAVGDEVERDIRAVLQRERGSR